MPLPFLLDIFINISIDRALCVILCTFNFILNMLKRLCDFPMNKFLSEYLR